MTRAFVTSGLAAAPVALALGALTPAPAYGYAIGSHVALCEDILDTLRAGESLVATPASTPGACAAPQPLVVPAAVRDALLSHPSHFLAGCVAPDAHVIPLLTDVTHAAAFEPLTLARLLVAEAESPAEIAYAQGWLAHIASDTAVHGFASWYAEGTFAEWDPGSLSTYGYAIRHVRSEQYLVDHWIKPPADFDLEVAAGLLRRTFLRLDGVGLRHLIARALGHAPAPGADPADVLTELVTTPLPEGVGLMARGTVVALTAFALVDAYLARLEDVVTTRRDAAAAEVARLETNHPVLHHLSPWYWGHRADRFFYERAATFARTARSELALAEEAFFAQNLVFSDTAIREGIFAALSTYVPYFKGLPADLAGRAKNVALKTLFGGWADAWVAGVGGFLDDVRTALGISDAAAWAKDRFAGLVELVEEHAWPWLLRSPLTAVERVVQVELTIKLTIDLERLENELEQILEDELDTRYPVRKDLIDQDLAAAGIEKGASHEDARACLRGYHFYHNARLLTWAGLVDPANLNGLASADLECEHRSTRFWRRYDGGEYTTFMRNVGPDPNGDRPYCFADTSSYTTRFAALYDEDRDWPFVDLCIDGAASRVRGNPAHCAVLPGTPGRCASGAAVFFSDTGEFDTCGVYEATVDIWKTSAGGSAARVWRSEAKPCDNQPCSNAPLTRALAPDGQAIAFLQWRGLPYTMRVVRFGGADLEVAVSEQFHIDPRWAPDSHALAVVGPTGGLSVLGPIRIADLDAGTVTEVLAQGYHPRWSHDSKSLYVYALSKPTDTIGRIQRVTFGDCGGVAPLAPTGGEREVPVTVARDGRVFFYVTGFAASTPYPASAGNQSYGLRSADGATSGRFTLPWATPDASFSPDGRWLVLNGEPPGPTQLGRSHVLLVDTAGGIGADGVVPATVDLGAGSTPLLSADGRWLAFQEFQPFPNQNCQGDVRFGDLVLVDLSLEAPAITRRVARPPCTENEYCDCGSPLEAVWSSAAGTWALYASFDGLPKPWRHETMPARSHDRDVYELAVPDGAWSPLTDTQAPFAAVWYYPEFDSDLGQWVVRCDPDGRPTSEDYVTGVTP